MASCSLFSPRVFPLISRQELETIIIFQRLAIGGVDWVREVHRHTSITKAGRSRVLFRSSNNDKVETREELRALLQDSGHSTENLDRLEFVSDKQHHIVSNKVGANKLARQAAQQWIREVEEKKMIRKGKIMTFKQMESLKCN